MFADETKIHCSYKTTSTNSITGQINGFLDSTPRNANKMHLGHDNTGARSNLNNTFLKETIEENDRGVVLTQDCKPSKQCAKEAAQAMNCLRVIKWIFTYFDSNSFSVLCKSYIQPHLKYRVQAWCPNLKKDIAILKKNTQESP